jgi:hypothetical protein
VHIVNAGGTPKRSERQLRDACRNLPGILVLNAIVNGAHGRVRELDGVIITPTGVFSVEVKGTQLTGTVSTDANRAWTIGGTEADFYGSGPDSSNPLRQARTGAQALAALLRDQKVEAGFVASVVAIAGNSLTLAPHLVGDTHVVTTRDIHTALASGKSRPLTVETVTAVCAALGVDVPTAAILDEGFAVPGSREARVTRNQQLREAATEALADAFGPLPGLLVIPGDHSGNGPDLSAVLVTPGGLYAVKSKATTLRGPLDTSTEPWTIGDTDAHFGRTAPEAQARSMAGWLRKELSEVNVKTKVTAIVTLDGPLDTVPHKSSGVWVTHTADLAGVLLRTRTDLSLEEAQTICAHLSHETTAEELLSEGFQHGDGVPKPEPAETFEVSETSSRQERRLQRLSRAQMAAQTDWTSHNDRRVVGSALAFVLLVGLVPFLDVASYGAGVLLTAVFGSWQLRLRSRYDGERRSGWFAVCTWVTTLVPVMGLFTAAASLSQLSGMPEAERPLASMLICMMSLLFATILLLGRSSFIYPPATVVERYDAKGKATGTYAPMPPPHPVFQRGRAEQLDGDWRPPAAPQA